MYLSDMNTELLTSAQSEKSRWSNAHVTLNMANSSIGSRGRQLQASKLWDLCLRERRRLLLRLLCQSSGHELIAVEPLVHSGLDASNLSSGERVGWLGRDALFIGTIGEIIHDLLDNHLLLNCHGHLLELIHATPAAASKTSCRLGTHHVVSSAKPGFVRRWEILWTWVRVIAASTPPRHCIL